MANLWLLLFLEILLFLLSFIFNEHDIMSPSCMIMLVFIFSTVVATLNGENWNIDYGLKTVGIIISGLSVFVITDICIADYYKNYKRNQIIDNTINATVIDTAKMIFTIILDMLILYFVYKEVIRIAGTGSGFTNMFYAYRQIVNSTSRTAEQFMNGFVVQCMKYVIGSGFICGVIFVKNVFVCKERLSKNIIYIVPGMIMSIMTFVTGNRTNILRLFVALLISTYILMQYKTNWSIRISWKYIKILACSLVVVFCFFSFSQVILGRSGATTVMDIISNYAGASIQLFNLYLENPARSNLVWGEETFQGIWSLLYKSGISVINVSAFSEFRNLNSMNIGNVYTFFRKFYHDFGFFGMIIMTMLIAVFFSRTYNYHIKCHTFNYKQIYKITLYGYLYYIIVIASVDNILPNYLSIGTLVQIMVFWFIYIFYFRVRIVYGKK